MSASTDPLAAQLSDIARTVGGPLLALDTSTARATICGVAWPGTAVIERDLSAASLPSESLVPALVELMAQHQLSAEQLRALVVGLGPGSFTGLRVGLATAKGIALGSSVPLYGTSSLAMLAAGHGPGLVAAVMDARVGEVFGALYEVRADGTVEPLVPDDAFRPRGLVEAIRAHTTGAVRLVGTGAPSLVAEGLTSDADPVVAPVIRAGFGILHLRARLLAGTADPVETLAPRYLRLSEAERELTTE